MAANKAKRNPWSFIPTQYFAEGLPYVLVNTLSVAMYSSLGIDNKAIGLTSLLYLPWAIKFFWAPAIDANLTKRKWILITELLLSILFFAIALILSLNNFFTITLIIFSIIAFVSATHDIVIDGFYLHALEKGEQAFFTGIRSTFYRISMIFGSGFLVSIAGYFGEENIKHGWIISFIISGAIFLLIYIYHIKILPFPKTDIEVRKIERNISSIPFAKVFKEYFSQKKIVIILAFILLYRFGEGLLVKMTQPFLLDKIENGGLNISLENLGIMYGTFGVLALLIGGILGGWTIKKYSLRKVIWIMALAMNLPNMLYIYLAYAKPDLWIVQASIIIEQFGYGFGFSAFLVYLLYISKGEFKTSFYAISTGIMAIGMMLPGLISGYIQTYFGYLWFFTISSLATIPGMLLIFKLPMDDLEE